MKVKSSTIGKARARMQRVKLGPNVYCDRRDVPVDNVGRIDNQTPMPAAVNYVQLDVRQEGMQNGVEFQMKL